MVCPAFVRTGFFAVEAELGRACRGVGFFYVSGHGISESLRETLFAPARTFFAMPAAAKEEYSIKRSPHNRGYVALEAERLDQSAAHSNYKEAYNVGLEIAAEGLDAYVEVLTSCLKTGAAPKYPSIPGADSIHERLTATYAHLRERE